ncbi:MAG: hypothetical protein JXA20_04360 [Spirochaetes bacterium]|nr:hypothetical protein [Spirochaetota bacterium]
METLLYLAKGPLFRFCIALMLLGSIRTVWSALRAARRAVTSRLPYPTLGEQLRETAAWMLPFNRIAGTRIIFSIVSFIFHLGLITVLLFLQDHVLSVRGGIGFGWPHMPRELADILTVAGLAAGISLLAFRVFDRGLRGISVAADYAVLSLILLAMAAGFAASRQWNPLPHDVTVLIHVIGGNIILALIPFTRLAHGLLFPFMRLATASAWRLQGRMSR